MEIKRLENRNNNVLQQLTDLTNKSHTESVSVSGVYDAPKPPLLLNNIPVVVPVENSVRRTRGVRPGEKRGKYNIPPKIQEFDDILSSDPGIENEIMFKPKIPKRPVFLKINK